MGIVEIPHFLSVCWVLSKSCFARKYRLEGTSEKEIARISLAAIDPRNFADLLNKSAYLASFGLPY